MCESSGKDIRSCCSRTQKWLLLTTLRNSRIKLAMLPISSTCKWASGSAWLFWSTTWSMSHIIKLSSWHMTRCSAKVARKRIGFGSGSPQLSRNLRGFLFFFARCCLGKVPGGAPFSQLHKGHGIITRTGQLMQLYKSKTNSNKTAAATNSELRGTGRWNGCESRETELIGEMHQGSRKVVREAPSRPPRCTGTMRWE